MHVYIRKYYASTLTVSFFLDFNKLINIWKCLNPNISKNLADNYVKNVVHVHICHWHIPTLLHNIITCVPETPCGINRPLAGARCEWWTLFCSHWDCMQVLSVVASCGSRCYSCLFVLFVYLCTIIIIINCSKVTTKTLIMFGMLYYFQ